MKFRIDDNIPKDELFAYLKANRKQLIEKKKSMPVYSEPFETIYVGKGGEVNKQAKDDNSDVVHVKVVANTSMYADNDFDVLGIDAGQKSITERGVEGKNIIPHLNGHVHTLDALVGDPTAIYYENLKSSDLGINTTIAQIQGLILESDVLKEYNPKIFDLYKKGKVKQHSIGMQYMKIELAINSDEDGYKEEFAVWQKYYDRILNTDRIEQRGYFWYVSEFKLIEVSAVLFGSNELTPTLEVRSKPSEDDTYKEIEPSENDTPKINYKFLIEGIKKF